jgi:hypothetical protein
VPLSVGHSVIAVGVRDPERKNSLFYRRELWPMLHVVFAVVEDGVGDWHAVVPESRREYSQTLAREAGASAPVRLEAWLGSTRRIVGAAEDIMDVLYEVTVEVVEQ